MIPQTLPQRPSSGSLTSKIFGHFCGWICGGVMLCWVASQAGPRTGTAIIHVTEPDVVVSVGGRTFQVGAAFHEPLVCDLTAGEHRLTMTRGATVLYADNCSIVGGEEQVLTTWRRPAEDTSRTANRTPGSEGSARGGHDPSRGRNPWHPEAKSHH